MSPGPIYVPGARITGRVTPPRPESKPWITVPDLTGVGADGLPADVLATWKSVWHDVGQNLPWYINHSRKTRKHLRAFAKRHGN